MILFILFERLTIFYLTAVNIVCIRFYLANATKRTSCSYYLLRIVLDWFTNDLCGEGYYDFFSVDEDDIVFRSSRSDVFCKKGVSRNFAKFTGKHLCQNFYFNKFAGMRPATLLK